MFVESNFSYINYIVRVTEHTLCQKFGTGLRLNTLSMAKIIFYVNVTECTT